VRHVAGERHQQHEQRRARRWGKEDGCCVIDGQKVPIQRTRLRTQDKREQRLGSYELFQCSGSLQQGVWDKMMRGLLTRNYGAVVKDFSAAYGIEKSAASGNFIEWWQGIAHGGPPARWRGSVHSALSGSQETQRGRSSTGGA
jgi:hypothetical protein